MAYNLSRMTIYAMVSAIEEDLRDMVKAGVGARLSSEGAFDQSLMSRAKQRLEKEKGFSQDDASLHTLVDYFDLGDTYQFINGNAADFPAVEAEEVKLRTKKLELLVPVRNRVMHIRPLNFSDLPSVSDFCREIVSASPRVWRNVKDTLEKLEDNPSYVLSLSIPSRDLDDRVRHNLPLPDFDETGLIGRDATLAHVKKLCLGGFPVISIVGEGGIGKSSLALKVAYELLDDPKSPFDAVVWVTSKTNQITANEIRDIRGAITSSMGVITEISEQLGGATKADPLSEVTEYLATFKIALFIDNLETILDDIIRQFVGALPDGSKIIITSRIGLGAYEYPVKLSGIEEKYASELLRTLGRLRNIKSIASQEEGVLRRYVNRMHLNPGYIKWFVSAMQAGQGPEAILQNSDLFLEFCMSNVYGFLSSDAREITATMQCEPGWKDLPELHFLSGLEALRIQKALQELMTTNMLSESSKSLGGSVRTSYQLAELARAYLNKHHRPSNSTQQRIKANRNRLNAMVEKNNQGSKNNRYDINTIKVRSKNDHIIFRRLREAMQFIQGSEFDKAYEILQESQKLSPDYFEVHRVTAHFNQRRGNFPEARASYELAITLAPETPQLHFWFGKFILRHDNFVDEAVEQFELARTLDPSSSDVAINLARGYLMQHRLDLVSGILAAVAAQVDSFDDHLRGMYYDTRIQVHYREADYQCTEGMYSESIEAMQRMRAEFDGLPADQKSSYLRQKLAKANVSLQRLARHCQAADASTVNELIEWVDRESVPAASSRQYRR